MKKLLLALLLCPTLAMASSKITNCEFNGVPLYGKVKVVESFPDFKVKIVNSFPDLKVKSVSSFPDKCGRWKFVESFPDFKVKFIYKISRSKTLIKNSV